MIGKYLVISFGFWKKKQKHSIPRENTTSIGAALILNFPLLISKVGFRRHPPPNITIYRLIHSKGIKSIFFLRTLDYIKDFLYY